MSSLRPNLSDLVHPALPGKVLLVSLLLCLVAGASSSQAQVDLLQSWEGAESGEQFGIAMALGGDADHDGRADLAIGASTNDEGGENAGKVSLYFGSATPGQQPDLELLGLPGSFFGAALDWAGDLNGDGHDDLVVGAFRDGEAGETAGKAYVFLGGDPMDPVPDLEILGTSAGAYFGRAVCGAGDINGDGYDDFAVGAPRTLNGTVYVFFGGDPLDPDPDLILDGAAEGDRFGEALAGPGNVDGLLGDDLLVGAPRSSPALFWQGEALLFSGGAPPDTLPDWRFLGEGGGDQLGAAVAGLGDVNGDGGLDLGLGAPYRNVGIQVDAGAAYVFYGGAVLDEAYDALFEGEASEENLGRSMAGCGDVTDSGFDHFIIGAPRNDVGGPSTGRALISPGGDPPRPADLIELLGEASQDQFGFSVAGVGPNAPKSFTGSAAPDVAVGAWGHGTGGKVYLYGVEGSGSGVPTDPVASAGATLRLKLIGNPGRTIDFQFANDGRRVPGSVRPVVRVLTADGRLVRRLPGRRSDGPLPMRTVHWDGRTESGAQAPAGLYLYQVVGARCEPQQGSLVVVR